MTAPPLDSVPDTASHVLEKVRSLTREISRLTTERDRLSTQLHGSRLLEEELRDERERLRLKLRDHQFREQELSRREESFERQLAVFKQRVVKLSEEKESLENKLNTFKGTTDSLHAGRETLTARLVDVETELSALRIDQESAKRKLVESESELGTLRRENTVLTDRLAELESASSKLTDDKGDLESAFREAHDKLNAATTERDAVAKELEETRGVRDQLQEELDRLVFRSRREYIRFGMIALAVVAIACFMFWASSALFNTGVKKDLTIAEQRLSELQTEIRSYLEKLREKNKEVVDREEEVILLEKALDTKKLEMEELQASYTAMRKEKDAKIERLGKELSWAGEQATGDVERVKAERDNAVATLNDKVQILKQEIVELRKTKVDVIPPLIDALTHPDVNVRVSASRALTKLTGKLYGPDQKKWREWWMRNRIDYGQ